MFRVLRVFLCVLSVGLLASCVESAYLPELNIFSKDQKQEQVKAAPMQETNRVIKPIEHKKVPSEVLLDTDGGWNLIEKSVSYDPTAAHLQARKNVNIKRRKKKSSFSVNFEPDAKSGQDGKLRVLRLEPQDAILDGIGSGYSGYEVASVLVKPTHMVAEKELVKKIALFLESDEAYGHGFMNSGVIITPPELPERKRRYKKIVAIPALFVIIPKKKPLIKKELLAPVPRTKPAKKTNIIRKIANVSYVRKLRSGIHFGKTRIVVEVSHTTKYKIAIDDLRNVFRMKLENTRWDIAPQGNLSGNSLLGTYIAKAQKDGSILLEIRLKKKSKIVGTMVLKPYLNSNQRVVIDLMGLGDG